MYGSYGSVVSFTKQLVDPTLVVSVQLVVGNILGAWWGQINSTT